MQFSGISVWDVTGDIRRLVEEAGVKEGFVNVINQHTTTGVWHILSPWLLNVSFPLPLSCIK
jgi:thiamine phosphate synthase YjbQ (UPF0047 family)